MKTKIPIDNKNISEDFSDEFHNSLYIERIKDNVHYQVFHLYDCLCELSYRFGQNWFKIRMIEGEPNDIRKCSAHLDYIIKRMNQDGITVEFSPILGVYEFYSVGM